MRMRKSIGLMAVALFMAACGSGDGGGGPTGGTTTGTLAGQVIDVDSSNGGVSNVVVQLTGPSGNQNATTNASGAWTVPNAAAGSWQATVQAPATHLLNTGEAGTRSGNVTAGQTTNMQSFALARPKGSITGSAEHEGAGIAGGTVAATRTGFPARNAIPTVTGFTIANVPVGNWNVAYTPPNDYVLAQGENGTRGVTVAAAQAATPAAFEIEPGQAGTVVVITASGASFSDNDITIAPGTTVRWVNGDGVTHTVTPENSSQAGGWSRAELTSSGAEFEHTFNVAGEDYRYRCEPHSSNFTTGMVGIIRVSN